jgi:hypothetical protein
LSGLPGGSNLVHPFLQIQQYERFQMKIATDLGSTSATLGTGNPDARMMSHLVPATSEAKTVVAQIPAPVAVNSDAKTLEGSHAGDSRGEAQGGTDPLKSNDSPVRSQTGTKGA